MSFFKLFPVIYLFFSDYFIIFSGWCPSTRYLNHFYKWSWCRTSEHCCQPIIIILVLSLIFVDVILVLSLELPGSQETILAQCNYLVVFCHQHVHYFFERGCWVIESPHGAGDLKVLVYFHCSEETLIISDQDPILAPKLEGLNVCHWRFCYCLEFGNNQLVIDGVSDLYLALSGTN